MADDENNLVAVESLDQGAMGNNMPTIQPTYVQPYLSENVPISEYIEPSGQDFDKPQQFQYTPPVQQNNFSTQQNFMQTFIDGAKDVYDGTMLLFRAIPAQPTMAIPFYNIYLGMTSGIGQKFLYGTIVYTIMVVLIAWYVWKFVLKGGKEGFVKGFNGFPNIGFKGKNYNNIVRAEKGGASQSENWGDKSATRKIVLKEWMTASDRAFRRMNFEVDSSQVMQTYNQIVPDTQMPQLDEARRQRQLNVENPAIPFYDVDQYNQVNRVQQQMEVFKNIQNVQRGTGFMVDQLKNTVESQIKQLGSREVPEIGRQVSDKETLRKFNINRVIDDAKKVQNNSITTLRPKEQKVVTNMGNGLYQDLILAPKQTSVLNVGEALSRPFEYFNPMGRSGDKVEALKRATKLLSVIPEWNTVIQGDKDVALDILADKIMDINGMSGLMFVSGGKKAVLRKYPTVYKYLCEF